MMVITSKVTSSFFFIVVGVTVTWEWVQGWGSPARSRIRLGHRQTLHNAIKCTQLLHVMLPLSSRLTISVTVIPISSFCVCFLHDVYLFDRL